MRKETREERERQGVGGERIEGDRSRGESEVRGDRREGVTERREVETEKREREKRQ